MNEWKCMAHKNSFFFFFFNCVFTAPEEIGIKADNEGFYVQMLASFYKIFFKIGLWRLKISGTGSTQLVSQFAHVACIASDVGRESYVASPEEQDERGRDKPLDQL